MLSGLSASALGDAKNTTSYRPETSMVPVLVSSSDTRPVDSVLATMAGGSVMSAKRP